MNGLLDADDRAQMAADRAEIRGDNLIPVTLRRGTVALDAQAVRIVGGGRSQGQRERSDGAASSVRRIVVLGAENLDIQPNDQFAYGGGVATVVAPVVRRHGQTSAEAEVRQ